MLIEQGSDKALKEIRSFKPTYAMSDDMQAAYDMIDKYFEK